MTKREATALSKAIAKVGDVRETGWRCYSVGSKRDYAIDCIDTTNGYAFVVYSDEDWRRQEIERS